MATTYIAYNIYNRYKLQKVGKIKKKRYFFEKKCEKVLVDKKIAVYLHRQKETT